MAIARHSTYQWRFPSFVSWRSVATSFPDSSRTHRKRRKLNTTFEKPNERRRFAHMYVRMYKVARSYQRAHACYIVSCAPLTSGRVRCVSRNQEKGKARNCLTGRSRDAACRTRRFRDITDEFHRTGRCSRFNAPFFFFFSFSFLFTSSNNDRFSFNEFARQ